MSHGKRMSTRKDLTGIVAWRSHEDETTFFAPAGWCRFGNLFKICNEDYLQCRADWQKFLSKAGSQNFVMQFSPTLAIKQCAVGFLCIMAHKSVLALASAGQTADAPQAKLQQQTLTGKHLLQCQAGHSSLYRGPVAGTLLCTPGTSKKSWRLLDNKQSCSSWGCHTGISVVWPFLYTLKQ